MCKSVISSLLVLSSFLISSTAFAFGNDAVDELLSKTYCVYGNDMAVSLSREKFLINEKNIPIIELRKASGNVVLLTILVGERRGVSFPMTVLESKSSWVFATSPYNNDTRLKCR